ncbi:MAG: hypothetical protein M5U08_15460 [Burkholderiales bacterium]|nr:hypothetical protein [Burkholderiales bacterium]
MREAEDALWRKFERDAIDAEAFALELDRLQSSVPVSEGEIEEENRGALARQRSFREAAHAVAAALATTPAVHKVMLFGSVASPLQREVPRFRRLRRARVEVLHECKDVDLALWIGDFADLRSIKRAASRALTEWQSAHPDSRGVAHHQVDMFLLDASTSAFRGNLCHYAQCPKGEAGVHGARLRCHAVRADPGGYALQTRVTCCGHGPLRPRDRTVAASSRR